MRIVLVAAVLVMVVSASAVFSRAQDELDRKLVPTGTFTGLIVKGPEHDVEPNWIYVKGVKGTMRKVDVATAKVSYADAVPKKDRKAKPVDCIKEGARVRVTAMQEADAWRATEIEILKTASN